MFVFIGLEHQASVLVSESSESSSHLLMGASFSAASVFPNVAVWLDQGL